MIWLHDEHQTTHRIARVSCQVPLAFWRRSRALRPLSLQRGGRRRRQPGIVFFTHGSLGARTALATGPRDHATSAAVAAARERTVRKGRRGLKTGKIRNKYTCRKCGATAIRSRPFLSCTKIGVLATGLFSASCGGRWKAPRARHDDKRGKGRRYGLPMRCFEGAPGRRVARTAGRELCFPGIAPA